MSTVGEIFFLICGIIALVSAVLTITLRTPLRSAVALLAHVISLAGLYLTLHAHLLAAIQVIVYAGAVVVLFVFVIMLMGPGAMEAGIDTKGWPIKTFGAGLIVLVAGAITFAVGETERPPATLLECPPNQAECGQFGGVNALAHAIYQDAAIPFELVSILLLVAIIAAIAIARGRSADEKHAADPLDARRLSPRPFPDDPVAPALNPAKTSIAEHPPEAPVATATATDEESR